MIKKVTICIPAYNEAPIIARTLATIQQFCRSHSKYEWRVVVADNGSNDSTGAIARTIPQTEVITVPVRGKGAAVVHIAQSDTSDVFCFIDADLSSGPEALPALIESVLNNSDIAIGSRLLDTTQADRSFLRTLSSKIFNVLRRFILGVKVSDSQCGLKAMNQRGRAILASCKETGWFFDMELLTKAERSQLQIKEIAVPWREMFYPERKSKLRLLRDGWQAILAMLRIRYNLTAPNDRKAVWALLLIATIVYFSFFFWYTDAMTETGKTISALAYERGDAGGYVKMADSILQGDASLVSDDELTRGLRTPGYPLFLAGVFTFTRDPLMVMWLQIAIGLATIPFLYSLGVKLFDRRVTFFAILTFILYPTTTFLTTQILSETLFLFLTALVLWLLFVPTTESNYRFLGMGLLAGTAILVRPSFLYVIPLIIAYLYVRTKPSLIWRTSIAVGLILIGTFITTAPWLQANNRDYGNAALSTAGAFNILYVYIPQFLAERETAESGWLSIQQQLVEETRAAGYEIGSHHAASYESNKIRTLLEGKEIDYVLFHVSRSVLTFVTSGIKMVNNEMTELGQPLFSATPWLIQHIYTYGISWDLLKNNLPAFLDAGLMALVALAMPVYVLYAFMRKLPNRWVVLFLLCMIIVTALLAGPNGNARYRMPLQPFIFLLAFASLLLIINRIKGYLPLLLSWYKKVRVSSTSV